MHINLINLLQLLDHRKKKDLKKNSKLTKYKNLPAFPMSLSLFFMYEHISSKPELKSYLYSSTEMRQEHVVS